MSLSTVFYSREFGGIIQRPGIEFTVNSFGWLATGGPDRAEIAAEGSEVDLWELVEYLRCPVELYNELGQACWWGYVEGVQVSTGLVTLDVSLNKMINKVYIDADTIDTGTVGMYRLSYAVENTISSGYYGTKEARFAISNSGADAGANYGNTLLARLKYPIPKIQIGSRTQARLMCRGWFDTLSWKLFSNTAGKESYETIGNGLQSFGNAAATTKVAQSFTLSSAIGWEANQVSLRMKKEGAPADNVTVSICADSSGPSTVLESKSLAASAISVNVNWVDFDLTNKEPLAISTTYWVTVERSGALDGTNYYKIDTNEALGYAGGAFKIWNGSAWVDRSPNADMLFIINGVRETSSQVSDIATSCGQFLAGVTLDIASGVYSIPYRDGNQDGLQSIMELLKVGTTNSRRMLCEVTKERRLRVYEEPAAGSNDYYLHSDGKLYDFIDQPLRAELYRPGVWARLKDIIPASADVSRFATPGLIFVEEAGYRNGVGYLRPRDADQLMEFSG